MNGVDSAPRDGKARLATRAASPQRGRAAKKPDETQAIEPGAQHHNVLRGDALHAALAYLWPKDAAKVLSGDLAASEKSATKPQVETGVPSIRRIRECGWSPSDKRYRPHWTGKKGIRHWWRGRLHWKQRQKLLQLSNIIADLEREISGKHDHQKVLHRIPAGPAPISESHKALEIEN